MEHETGFEPETLAIEPLTDYMSPKAQDRNMFY